MRKKPFDPKQWLEEPNREPATGNQQQPGTNNQQQANNQQQPGTSNQPPATAEQQVEQAVQAIEN